VPITGGQRLAAGAIEHAPVSVCPVAEHALGATVGTVGHVELQPHLRLGVRAVPLDQADVACQPAKVPHHRVVHRSGTELTLVLQVRFAVLEVDLARLAAAVGARSCAACLAWC